MTTLKTLLVQARLDWQDPDRNRERLGRMLVHYGQIPSYRAMLDREGASGPGGRWTPPKTRSA